MAAIFFLTFLFLSVPFIIAFVIYYYKYKSAISNVPAPCPAPITCPVCGNVASSPCPSCPNTTYPLNRTVTGTNY